jgi:hypothetical protein
LGFFIRDIPINEISSALIGWDDDKFAKVEKGTRLSTVDSVTEVSLFPRSRIAVASNNHRNQNHTQDYHNSIALHTYAVLENL